MRHIKLLIVGDLHANGKYFKHVVSAADVAGCAGIVQCGDIGYWPHTDPDYLDDLAYELGLRDNVREEHGLAPLWLVWVDGNHENFDALFGQEWPTTDRGFWKMNERIFYAPRGLVWEWDGVRFLALGGGNSIDKEFRTPGRSWWEQELITDADVAKAIENAGDGVDVMICHDMPEGVVGGPELLIKGQPEDDANRRRVLKVVWAAQPKLLYHGHYHHRYMGELRKGSEARIIGLGMDNSFEKNWTILDLEEEFNGRA